MKRFWETGKLIRGAIGRPGKSAISLFALVLVLLAASGGWVAWDSMFGDLPSPETLYERAAVPSTRIFDRKGRLLYEVMDPHAGKHSPVSLEEIPLVLREATIATEDGSFYQNPGIDVKAILRAIIINVQSGEILSGGSTITQQLARNLLLSPEERGQQTLLRKLREMVLAWRLSWSYSKDDVLALYLNETYYGNWAYGVEAASRAYFGKPVGDLDLAECAMLAGLPQAPAIYDPLVDPGSAKGRQSIVLGLMVKAGFIGEEEAELAEQERLHFAASPFPIRAPHFVMHVRRLLEDRFGLDVLYQGGLRVHTTLDLDMQNTARDVVRRQLARLTERKDGLPVLNVRNGALVVLDPQTGEILAMLGSPDYFDPRIDGAVNVTLATRQPGSSIKPITYALAFSQDYTPATMLLDVRTSYQTKEGDSYVPYNYDRLFRGPVLLREALASSLNLLAVKVLDHVKLNNMIDFAREFGIRTFDDSDRFGLALTLGGGEVRLLELTAAYGAFANGGHRLEPVAITLVEDAEGRVLARWEPDWRQQILDPRVAYLVTDILSDDTARMTGFGPGSVLNLTRPAAVKTGTTTDWRDNWTIGYTPDLVVGVWVGNADNEPMGHVSGVTGAAPIWHDYMEEVLKGLPPLTFEAPPGLVRVEVCAESGLLPTENCLHRKTELFIDGTEPQQFCSFHQRFRIDRDTGQMASAGTPPGRVIERVFTILPAEAEEWARERNLPRPPAASPDRLALAMGQDESGMPITTDARGGESMVMPASRGVHSEPPLIMTGPDSGSAFRLSPQIPSGSQCVEVSARSGEGSHLDSVTLLVDGVPLDEYAHPPYRAVWCLEPGEHVFQAIGVGGEGQQVESRPVHIAVIE